MHIEEYCSVQCPYCYSSVRILIDFSGGARQTFTYDCEICCKPILIKVEVKNGRVLSLDAQQEY